MTHYAADIAKPAVILIRKDYEGTSVGITLNAVATLMEKVLETIAEKDFAYGAAWKRQGWMGNLARVMSKTERLKAMLWKDLALRDSEGPQDTALDLVAIASFFYLNYVNQNKWGEEEP